MTTSREVRPIPYDQAVPWFLHKHYAKRVPGSVMFTFGLYLDGTLEGVCSYGMSPNSQLNEIAGKRVLELNRVCINDGIKNAASYMVSQTYKHLRDFVLLSYADDGVTHKGYIYQALNWVYTGMSTGGVLLETANGIVHKRAYDQRGMKDEILSKTQSKKHRYFYVPSRDKDVEKAIVERFGVFPYPKGKSERYISPDMESVQNFLF